MNKAEFIGKVQGSTAEMSKKETAGLVDAVFATIAAAIKKEGKFAYPGFGTFTVRKRAARKGRNPRTKKEIMIKASKTVAFKPAPSMKEKL